MDLNYLFHRQQVERTRAEAADSREAQVVHEQLARCYEAQIGEATGGRIYPQTSTASRRPLHREQPVEEGAVAPQRNP